MKKVTKIVAAVVCALAVVITALIIFVALYESDPPRLHICPTNDGPAMISQECPPFEWPASQVPLVVWASTRTEQQEAILKRSIETINSEVGPLFILEFDRPSINLYFGEAYERGLFEGTETTSFEKIDGRWHSTIRIGNTPDDDTLYQVLTHALLHSAGLDHSLDTKSFLRPLVPSEIDVLDVPVIRDRESTFLKRLYHKSLSR